MDLTRVTVLAGAFGVGMTFPFPQREVRILVGHQTARKAADPRSDRSDEKQER